MWSHLLCLSVETCEQSLRQYLNEDAFTHDFTGLVAETFTGIQFVSSFDDKWIMNISRVYVNVPSVLPDALSVEFDMTFCFEILDGDKPDECFETNKQVRKIENKVRKLVERATAHCVHCASIAWHSVLRACMECFHFDSLVAKEFCLICCQASGWPHPPI